MLFWSPCCAQMLCKWSRGNYFNSFLCIECCNFMFVCDHSYKWFVSMFASLSDGLSILAYVCAIVRYCRMVWLSRLSMRCLIPARHLQQPRWMRPQIAVKSHFCCCFSFGIRLFSYNLPFSDHNRPFICEIFFFWVFMLCILLNMMFTCTLSFSLSNSGFPAIRYAAIAFCRYCTTRCYLWLTT